MFETISGNFEAALRLAENVSPGITLAIYLVLTGDTMQRAQSIPYTSPLCIEWPRYLLSLLTLKTSPPAHQWASTVINVKSGYARTNRSATVEHLLQKHTSEPTRRGLTITFLYTSDYPNMSSSGGAIQAGSVAVLISQLVLAWTLPKYGIGSSWSFLATALGANLSFLSSQIMLRRRRAEISTARTVPAGKREAVCVTSGNGSSDAVVVVTEAGGAKLEDIAGGRTNGLGALATAGIAGLLFAWAALFVMLAGLPAKDAWPFLALAALGTAHEIWAARTWRSAEALGFKIQKKIVVHEEKVMTALMKAEEVESSVGLALLPVFFPGPLRPKEEEWWDGKKAYAKEQV